MLCSTMYVSRSLLVLPCDNEQIAAITLVAACRNHALDLTGVMIVASKWFAQYLEGEADALAEVMASIRLDRRHTDLCEWLPPQLAQRRFPNWRMVVFGPSEKINRKVEPILGHLNGTLPDRQKTEMIQLMNSLAHTRSKMLADG